VPTLLIARVEMRASPQVKEVTSEQIGTALRGLAADLVAERRRVALLQRENRELRAEIEDLRRAAGETEQQSYLGPPRRREAVGDLLDETMHSPAPG
jgi:hypothetical protein